MLIGADPEKLDKLAEMFKSGAKQMDKSANGVTTALSRVRWEGRDANDFRRRWTSTHRPLLHRVADEMGTMSRHLFLESREQRETSEGGFGITGGGSVDVITGGGGPAIVGIGADARADRGGGGADPITGKVDIKHTKVDNTHKKVSGTKEWVKGPDGKYHAVEKDPNAPKKEPSRTKVSAEVSTEVASDHREKIIGAHGETSGEYHGAVDAKGSVEATAGIKATNDASIKVGADGVTASAEGRVMAGVEVSAQGEVGKGPVKVSGGANAMTGAEASYNASARVGMDGVEVKGGADAFVGGRAGVDGAVDIGGAKVGGGASVEYGLGAGAKGGVSFNTHKIGISGDAHVSLGLGVQFKVDLSVDPSKVAKNVGKVADFAGDAAGGAKKLVTGAVKHVPHPKVPWWR